MHQKNNSFYPLSPPQKRDDLKTEIIIFSWGGATSFIAFSRGVVIITPLVRGHKINNENTLCSLGHSPGKVGCPIHAAAKMLKLWLLCLPPCPLSSSEPRCICITWEQQRTHPLPCGATATSPLCWRGRPSTSVLLEILFFLTSL